MSWQAATVIGSLGVSFYLLYLNSTIHEEKAYLKLFLILSSVLSIFLTLSHIHQIIIQSDPGATENITLAVLYYNVYVYFTILFISLIILGLFGEWLQSWRQNQ